LNSQPVFLLDWFVRAEQFGTLSRKECSVLQSSDGSRIVVAARSPESSAASVMIQIFSPCAVL
jgi:hypothetical protein